MYYFYPYKYDGLKSGDYATSLVELTVVRDVACLLILS